jgi:hypothetical protein
MRQISPPTAPTSRSSTAGMSRCSESDALFVAHGLNGRYDLIRPPAGVDLIYEGGLSRMDWRIEQGGGNLLSLLSWLSPDE